MLINGITIGYNKTAKNTYTILNSLKKVPDLGAEPELIENSTINARNKQYEIGVGDAGDLEFTFKYDDNKAGNETRVLLEMGDAKASVNWELTYPDRTKYQFSATPSVRLIGGELNSPVEIVVKLAINSNITRVDPS